MALQKSYYESETGCCKRFDPKPWDEKEIVFKNKLFLKGNLFCFFNIPLNFGGLMVRNMEKILAANALAKNPVVLYYSKSLFSADVYIAIEKSVPDSQMETISGTFLSKVFEGSFKDTGKWVKEMKDFVKSKNKEIKKLYFFYTSCPKCAQYYGKNYVVLLAEI